MANSTEYNFAGFHDFCSTVCPLTKDNGTKCLCETIDQPCPVIKFINHLLKEENK